jgi:hypothetical protein
LCRLFGRRCEHALQGISLRTWSVRGAKPVSRSQHNVPIWLDRKLIDLVFYVNFYRCISINCSIFSYRVVVLHRLVNLANCHFDRMCDILKRQSCHFSHVNPSVF